MDYKELYILHLHFPASGALRDEVAMETPLHHHTPEEAVAQAQQVAQAFTAPTPDYWYLEDSAGLNVFTDHTEQVKEAICYELQARKPHLHRVTETNEKRYITMKTLNTETATLQELADHLNKIEGVKVALKGDTLHFTGFKEKGICPSVSNIDLISRWAVTHGCGTQLLCDGEELRVTICGVTPGAEADREAQNMENFIEYCVTHYAGCTRAKAIEMYWESLEEELYQEMRAQEAEEQREAEEAERIATATYFVKEFTPAGNYSIGMLIGEPNENGEQGYCGYFSTPTSLAYITDDFLCDEDLAELHSTEGVKVSPYPSTPDTYQAIQNLFGELMGILHKHGTKADDGKTLSSFSVEALEELIPADTPERAQVIGSAEEIISKAYQIISH